MGNGPRFPRQLVEPHAERLVGLLGGRAVVAGSLRRGATSVGDIDLVLVDIERTVAIETLVNAGLTPTNLSEPRDELIVAGSLRVDVWTPSPGMLGACIMHATGPGIYNTVMRRWARMHGMRLSWDGVWRGDVKIAGKTESECCAALGWPDPPPEHRERFWEWIDPYLRILDASES